MPTSPEGTVVVSHLWKRFKADRSRALLRDEIERLRSRLRGDTSGHWRWALRDLSFRIEPGESVGLVGTNGSGKSTLLKILTEVMYPYAGRVEVAGRVGALIEVRAGIHPDLTGRENIGLYGTLLGLTRAEVARRFDSIVEFAELPDAVDRQVKFYSSGMQMRLGFAVAAFLQPDVLLVDEVLAVGDASFQQKCLDRMGQVIANGTTLVFVSHDLHAVEAACTRGIWLRDGEIAADGPVRETLAAYREAIEEVAAADHTEGRVRLAHVEISGPEGDQLRCQASCHLRLTFDSDQAQAASVSLGVSEGTAAPIFLISREVKLGSGRTEVRCVLARLPLPSGRYYLWVGVFGGDGDLLAWQPVAAMQVEGAELDPAPSTIVRMAPVHVEASWDVDSA